jgi:hypothetical protein
VLKPVPLTVDDALNVVNAPVLAVVAPTVVPSIVPPVIATALAFWEAIVPRFEVRATVPEASGSVQVRSAVMLVALNWRIKPFVPFQLNIPVLDAY